MNDNNNCVMKCKSSLNDNDFVVFVLYLNLNVTKSHCHCFQKKQTILEFFENFLIQK